MTHTKLAMYDLIVAYCLAIGSLIKNAGEENRAQLALQAVFDYSQRFYVEKEVGLYYIQAQRLFEKHSQQSERHDDTDDKGLLFFNNEMLDV